MAWTSRTGEGFSNIIEMIGGTPTNLLYVTNHRDEILNCITHVMRLHRGKVLSQGKKEEVLQKHTRKDTCSVQLPPS